jgi:hypothetical protein
MVQVPYDDGGGHFDVRYRCDGDGCLAEQWGVTDDVPATWVWTVGSCDGPDYCPECAKRLGLSPGGVLAL